MDRLIAKQEWKNQASLIIITSIKKHSMPHQVTYRYYTVYRAMNGDPIGWNFIGYRHQSIDDFERKLKMENYQLTNNVR